MRLPVVRSITGENDLAALCIGGENIVICRLICDMRQQRFHIGGELRLRRQRDLVQLKQILRRIGRPARLARGHAENRPGRRPVNCGIAHRHRVGGRFAAGDRAPVRERQQIHHLRVSEADKQRTAAPRVQGVRKMIAKRRGNRHEALRHVPRIDLFRDRHLRYKQNRVDRIACVQRAAE